MRIRLKRMPGFWPVVSSSSFRQFWIDSGVQPASLASSVRAVSSNLRRSFSDNFFSCLLPSISSRLISGSAKK